MASYRPNPDAAKRNLVIVVVDALRPDHMGVYGYRRDTTPAISQLTKNHHSRRVDGMRSVCGQSECGLMGLALSKYAHQFSTRMFSIVDVLHKHGYKTHMLLSGDHSNFYGLRESYGTPDSYYDGAMASRTGKYVNGDRFVIEKLRTFPESDGTPTMFQFHLMATHPFGAHKARPKHYQPAVAYAMHWRRKVLTDPGSQLSGAVNFYDNAVRDADSTIHELLTTLQVKGYLKNALVAITADHGEALGEHGIYSHAQSVREPTLKIPFILASIGGPPIPAFDTTRSPSQVDIAPTLLAEMGMPQPSTWSGVPLQKTANRRFSFFEERDEVGLIEVEASGKLWKYWRDRETGEEFAFDLGADPKELQNRITVLPEARKAIWRRVIDAGRREDNRPSEGQSGAAASLVPGEARPLNPALAPPNPTLACSAVPS